MTMVRGVHLVGSVPLPDAHTVFCTTCSTMPGRLRRIPDGETGERFGFHTWQNKLIGSTKGMKQLGPAAGPLKRFMAFGLEPGVEAADIDFGNLGIGDAALASFATFDTLQRDGAIPAGVRFQVSIFLPMEVTSAYMLADFEALEPRYEAAMKAEVEKILKGIPNDRLAVQWDVVASNFWIRGEGHSAPFTDPLPAVLQRLSRYASWLPKEVEMGYHLCFGDGGPGQVVGPADSEAVVTLANALFETLPRSVQWVHLPVPVLHGGPAFFEPFKKLKRPPGLEIYLGLVSAEDGVEGARQRIAEAEGVFDEFGVATACGMGRLRMRGGTDETLGVLLEAQAAVSTPAL